jgi:tartrate dehydrogenase/decarboxylase/D-malate dehydrogenase
MKSYRVATISGDGIGKEVVPEGIRVVDAAAKKAGIRLDWEMLPWSCEYYNETGKMMPEDGLDRIRNHDAIFLGAIGFPSLKLRVSVRGGVSLLQRNRTESQ